MPKKPKIAWIVDRRRWAQERRGESLVGCLGEFQMEVMTAEEFQEQRPKDWDGAWFASWRTAKLWPKIILAMGSRRCGVGVASHYEIGPMPEAFRDGADPNSEFSNAIEFLANFRIVGANSEPLFSVLSTSLQNLRYLPSGVNTVRWHPLKVSQRLAFIQRKLGWSCRKKAAKNIGLYAEVADELKADYGDVVELVALSKDEAGISEEGMFWVYHTWAYSLCLSVHEGMSNVLLESAACGIPAISTPVGDHQKLVRDGDTGFIVAADVHSVCCAASKALDIDEASYRRMSHAIRTEIESSWSWAK